MNPPPAQPQLWPQQWDAGRIIRIFDISTDRKGQFTRDRALPGEAKSTRKVLSSKEDWDSPWTDANSRSVELFSGRTLSVSFNDSALPMLQERENDPNQSQSATRRDPTNAAARDALLEKGFKEKPDEK